MSSKEIANTILTQLRYGNRRNLMVMSWGFHSLQYGCDKNVNLGFLQFKVNGRHFKGVVKVSLKFNDTYRVEFIKTKRVKNKELSELYGKNKFDSITEVVKEMTLEEVYFDELTELIDKKVEYINDYSF